MDQLLVVLPFELADEKMADLNKQLEPLSYSISFLEPIFPYENMIPLIQPTTGAVISRGGIGQFLRKHVHLPIIDVPVTSYDLLEAIRSVHDQGYRRLRIIVSAAILSQTTPIHLKLEQFFIEMESYTSQGEARKKIRDIAVNRAADVILGDRFATEAAREYGLHSHLLQSGEEALQVAIKNAIHTVEVQKKEKAKRIELESVLYHFQQAVVTVNSHNEISTFNEKARNLFPSLAVGQTYETIFPYPAFMEQLTTGREGRNVLVTFDQKKAFMTTIPLFLNGAYTGAVQIFEEVAAIQKLELEIRKELHKKGLIAKHTFADILAFNPDMQALVQEAASYAKSEGTVVIYGESGTGKELFAQSIHNAGSRAAKPFVSLNCGVPNESLLESELFGYEEGAFTGAMKGGKKGLFELAHEGTLFLDEIGEMSLTFQTKLLRVIQEMEIRRVGGERYIPVDVRIICATNHPLEELIEQGKFKEDLYYRLAILELDLPPLRRRKEDIIPMALAFLEKDLQIENRTLTWESEEVFAPLLTHPWYGNARELQNFIHRLVITFPEQQITKKALEAFLQRRKKPQTKMEIPVLTDVKKMEEAMWQELYKQFKGTKAEFCETYQISPTTLWRKLHS